MNSIEIVRDADGTKFTFEYKSVCNVSRIREFLHLDKEESSYGKLPPLFEQARLSGILERHGALSSEDKIILRKRFKPEENPLRRDICETHGDWYHDAFGCMHHDHTDTHHSDLPPAYRVCKE